MIILKNVQFQYNFSTRQTLQNLSLTIEKGEFIGVVGPTGSGKSSFCYLLNGLIPHSFRGTFEGTVQVGPYNSQESSVEEMSSLVGLMLQEPSFQIATPLVESEIAFGMENFSFGREEMAKTVSEILTRLGLMHLRNRTTASLSEGEKQRVILASILSLQPEVLVLDECSSMIDLASKKVLSKILIDLHKNKGKTIVMVDHDLDFLLTLTERTILINNGKIVADGPTEEILTNRKLLAENNLEPPALVSLFEELHAQGLPLTSSPTSYEEAETLLKELLEI